MQEFNSLLEMAFHEDLEEIGDITSRAIFPGQSKCSATLYSKDTGVLAGLPFFKQVFLKRNAEISIELLKTEGEIINSGDKIASLKGNTCAILEAERTAINFISFLSGIASKTRELVNCAKEQGDIIILDTRKTLPAYRKLSKYAVKVGGGQNHRMGLYDMVMIKDNHIDAAGSITQAVQAVREKWGNKYRIEVECRNLEEVKEALSHKVDVIMLDNMNRENIQKSIKIINQQSEIELSGNMDIKRIKELAMPGINFISSGALSHSVRAFDFSLKIDIDKQTMEKNT